MMARILKARNEIRSYPLFEESEMVDMSAVKDALTSLREVLNCYKWKDIYSIYEIGLLYRMQVSNFQRTSKLIDFY